MKKILTIAAVLSSIASIVPAHAAPPVNTTLNGNIPSSCNVTIASPSPTLTANAALTTLTGSSVATVICNDTSKSLKVGLATSGNTLNNGTAAAVLNGGTGNFVSSTGTQKAITAATPTTGDTANISTTVSAPANSMLQSGNYVVVVEASITP